MKKPIKILIILIIIFVLLISPMTNWIYVKAKTIYYEEAKLEKMLDNLYKDKEKVTDFVLKQNLGDSYDSILATKESQKGKGLIGIDESVMNTLYDQAKDANIKILLEERDKVTQQTTTATTSGTSTVTSGTGSAAGTSTATSGTGSTPETSSGLEMSTSSSESSDFGDTYYIPKKLKRYPGNIYKVNASRDENKNTEGGKAGDQNGEEITIKPFAGSRKFSIFRYPDSKVARTIAFYLGDIAANNNVGYDQLQRETLGIEMAKVNYDPENLATPCETDCSAFTSHGIKFAFMKAGISKSVTEEYTSTLREKLPEWGFQEISEIGTGTLEELAKTQKLQIGDIALTVGSGHVTVCIGDYYFSDQTPPSSPGSYGSGVSGGYTADGEEIDDRQNIDEKRFRFSGLPGDVTYEGEINPIRNFFKKIGDFIDYLLGLLFLIIKVLIIGFTNIIYNIFLIMVSFMKK